MYSNEIIRTIVKLTGLVIFLYTVVQAASYLPYLAGQYRDENFNYLVLSLAGTILIPLLFSLLLWLFPARVTNTIVMNESRDSDKSELLLDLEKIGIRVMGIYLLYHGISDLVANFTSYRYALSMFEGTIGSPDMSKYYVSFIATAVELFMSLFLILGTKGISNAIRKIRYA